MLPTIEKLTGIKMWEKHTKSELRRLIGWITGHCPLNRHLTMMKIIAGKACRLCGEDDETPHHLTTSCPGTAQDRHDFLMLATCPDRCMTENRMAYKDHMVKVALYMTNTKTMRRLMAWQEPVAVQNDMQDTQDTIDIVNVEDPL